MRIAVFVLAFAVSGCAARIAPNPPPPPVPQTTTEMPSPDAKPLNAPCVNESTGTAWVTITENVTVISENLPACQWAIPK